MNAKKLIPLVISVFSALVLLAIVLHMSRQTGTSIIPQKRPQVVIAKTGIDAGGLITEEALSMGDLAADAPPDTIFHSPGDLIGRVASVPIVPGQVITSTALTPKGTGPGLPALIPLGMRAITLEITEMTGVAGNILPGAHVDIIQTMRDDQTGDSLARTIAQNVKVMSCGMRHGPDGDGGGRSITLAVTPQQAELLELSAATGKARMSLRGSTDVFRSDIAPVTLTDLRGRAGNRVDPLSVVKNPSTQPASNSASASNSTSTPAAAAKAKVADMWRLSIIRGGSEQIVEFPLHPDTEDQDVRTSPEFIEK